MKRCAAVIAVFALMGSSVALAQPSTPTSCGQLFKPNYTYVSVCRFATPFARHAAADRNAASICSSKFGSRCPKAVRVATDSSKCTGYPSHTCRCPTLNTYRCVSSTGPDLSASITYRSAVTRQLRVCQVGATSPVSTWVGLYLDDMPNAADCRGTQSGRFDRVRVTLPAGAYTCEAGELDFTGLPTGIYKIGLKADDTCSLTEPKETNNLSVNTVTIGAGRTDLSARMTATPLGSRRVRYNITLCRSGLRARPARVRLFVTSTATGSVPGACTTTGTQLGWTDAEFPPGCITVPVEVGFRPAGRTERACIAVDTRCLVPESNERNNVACATYRVR